MFELSGRRCALRGGSTCPSPADDIDVIRLDLPTVPHLLDGHRRGALEQLDERPAVGWVEVLDDDEGHPALLRHLPEELLERLEPAGGGADAHDGEALGPGRGWRRLGARLAAAWCAGEPSRGSTGFDDLASSRPSAGVPRVVLASERFFFWPVKSPVPPRLPFFFRMRHGAPLTRRWGEDSGTPPRMLVLSFHRSRSPGRAQPAHIHGRGRGLEEDGFEVPEPCMERSARNKL